MLFVFFWVWPVVSGRTVSGVDLGLGAGGLADEDGDAGVASLHGRVGPGDE